MFWHDMTWKVLIFLSVVPVDGPAPSRHFPALKKSDGSCVMGEREHHDVASLPHAPSKSIVRDHVFRPNVSDIIQAISAMACGRAAGPDMIPIELIKAGAAPMVISLHVLLSRIVDEECISFDWKGGRICSFHNKGLI